LLEDYDTYFSVLFYFLEGSLGPGEWLRSYRRLEETAWFDIKDPMPFMKLHQHYGKRLFGYGLKRLGLDRKKPSAQLAPN